MIHVMDLEKSPSILSQDALGFKVRTKGQAGGKLLVLWAGQISNSGAHLQLRP